MDISFQKKGQDSDRLKGMLQSSRFQYVPVERTVVEKKPQVVTEMVPREVKDFEMKKVLKKGVKEVQKTIQDYITVQRTREVKVSEYKQQICGMKVAESLQTEVIPFRSMRIVQSNPYYNDNVSQRTHIHPPVYNPNYLPFQDTYPVKQQPPILASSIASLPSFYTFDQSPQRPQQQQHIRRTIQPLALALDFQSLQQRPFHLYNVEAGLPIELLNVVEERKEILWRLEKVDNGVVFMSGGRVLQANPITLEVGLDQYRPNSLWQTWNITPNDCKTYFLSWQLQPSFHLSSSDTHCFLSNQQHPKSSWKFL